VGTAHTILAKVLASRLVKAVGKVVGPNQVIWDDALIANECVDSYIKSWQGGVFSKLDIEKACDHVSWSFLLATTITTTTLSAIPLTQGLGRSECMQPYRYKYHDSQRGYYLKIGFS